MGFNTNGLTVFYKPWFDGVPKNAKKASGTISFTGIVSDTQTVTIGDQVYEFDYTNAVTAGHIKVDMSGYLTTAKATLTFSDVVVAAETVTIGSGDDAEVYEFVAVAGDVAAPTNIPVIVGADLSVDNAVTKLGEAISSNSVLVDAVSNIEDNTVLLVARTGGTGANTLAITETVTNATFGNGVTTLSGGANTISASNAATLLNTAINANTNEVCTSVVNEAGTGVIVTYKLVGTDGNSVALAETCANGTVDHNHLQNGCYATPCNVSAALIVLNGTIYYTDKPCTKWTEDAWYSCSTTLL